MNRRAAITISRAQEGAPMQPHANKGPFRVPEDQVDAGRNTDLPRQSDSPESLDADIRQGAARLRFDPSRSVAHPPVDKSGNYDSSGDRGL